MMHENRISHDNNGAQGDRPFGQLAPPKEVNLAFAAQLPARHQNAPMIRYTRMMNSVQNEVRIFICFFGPSINGSNEFG